jgi:queuine tRNA-ribosyltransferase
VGHASAGARANVRAPVSCLAIRTRDPQSRARTGTLRLAHGEVRTPAFVPLATKAVIKTLEVREAADLGYDMVLGNTFHLFLTPGHQLIARLGGLHRFMAWDRPVMTDSGGFQVFSMGHGTVADEIKGRAAQSAGDRAGAIVAIEERGVTFRSYLDGSERFMAPETSMEVQAALGADIALVFDECTPFHGGREYTARSTERTHRWLDRCLAWHADHGPEDQVVYGIVQGGVEEDLRRASAQEVAARPVGGIAIGGTLGEDKAQMFEVVEWAVEELDEARPRHLLGIGEIDDLVRGVELGMDTFDCAVPTRIGRHGMAVVPDPEHRWRVDLGKSGFRVSDEPLLEGCPCPACRHGYTRAYLHYLLKVREQTAQRLLTIHNLAYVQRLMAALRAAIDAGRLPAEAAALRAGAAPWEL